MLNKLLFTVLVWFVRYLEYIALYNYISALLLSLRCQRLSDEWSIFVDPIKESRRSVLFHNSKV